MRSTARAFALALFLGLIAAAPAAAGQIVYSSNDNIMVANDDGSDVRTLLTPADVPGATSLYDVNVDPNGTKIVFSARTPHSGGIFCGFNCVGVYVLDGSSLSRVSGAPAACADDPCLGLEVGPKITADGNRVFYQRIYGEPGGTYGTPQTIAFGFVAPAVADGARQETELTKEAVGAECARPNGFVPNPANGDEFAWVDCWRKTYQDPNEPTSALRVGNQTIGGDDYYEIVGIAWRPDGQQLVTVEEGDNKGIWVYNRDGSGTPKQVLDVASFDSDNFQSNVNPTWIGSDRIAYHWGGQIRTIPTSCDKCTPDQGTALLATPDNGGQAWTSRSVPSVQRGGDNGNQNPNNGNNGNNGQNGQPNQGGFTATLAPKKLKLATALKGLTVPFTATGPGTLSLKAQLDAKTAKKLKLIKKGSKPVSVASGKAAPTAAGASTVKLKFTKAAAKRLKKAKSLKLKLTGSFTPAGGGAAQPITATVTLKR